MIGSSQCCTALLFSCFAQGLRLTSFEVPKYVMVGDSTTLRCHFNLENEKLYTLTWWKDDRLFYQYIPKKDVKTVIYNVPGVIVNEAKSTMHNIELMRFQKTSGGNYRCEVVGEAPTFNTAIKEQNVTIIDPPDGPPVVHGLKHIYHAGEVIKLNCTSYRSRPAPRLRWEVFSPNAYSSLSKPANSISHSYFKPSILFNNTAIIKRLHRSPFSTRLDINRSDEHHQFNSSVPISYYFYFYNSAEHKKNIFEATIQKKEFHTKQKSKLSRRKEGHKRIFRTIKNPSNYTEIVDKYLIKYANQISGENPKAPVYSSTLGLHFSASLHQSSNGQLILRCQTSISKYHWATEVRINIATIPVADPQQLPTLHGTSVPKNLALGLKYSSSTVISSACLAVLQFFCEVKLFLL